MRKWYDRFAILVIPLVFLCFEKVHDIIKNSMGFIIKVRHNEKRLVR